MNLAVNANNLFDKKYWVAGFNQLNGSNNYGEPRNFMLTVKYTATLTPGQSASGHCAKGQ